jgi:RHS repeat-associated protein
VADARNRRIGRRVNGVVTHRWLYQGQLRPVAELDASGAVISRFVYGARPVAPEYMIRGGVTYRLVTDQLGSVRLVVDLASGAIAQRIDYDAWGQMADTHPGFQPFGYAGGVYDPLTGLVRFGARDYDAETGRWTARDPIGFSGRSTNLYSYVSNDPVNRTDPTGLCGQDVDWLKVMSDVTAGFGDELTSLFGLLDRSLTERIRERYGIDVADHDSWSYFSGERLADLWSLFTGGTGAARVMGWQTRIAIHGAHHTFGRLGKLVHIQLNFWKIGVSRSGGAVRIPLPWR